MIAVRREVAQKIRIGAPVLKQFSRDRIHFPEAIVAEDDIQVLVGVDERARHVVERYVKLGLLACQFLLGSFLLRDIRHDRHDTTGRSPTTVDPVAPTIGCDVLKTLAGRMTQAFNASGGQRLHIAPAVITVGREIEQELRIGLARPKQVGGDRIHVSEAAVAENDVQVRVGIDERVRHVVERDLQVTIRNDSSPVQTSGRFVHRTTRSVLTLKSVSEPDASEKGSDMQHDPIAGGNRRVDKKATG